MTFGWSDRDQISYLGCMRHGLGIAELFVVSDGAGLND